MRQEIPVVASRFDEDYARAQVKKKRFAYDAVESLYYPLYAFHLAFDIKRLFFGPRRADVFVLVDAARRVPILVDLMPETEPESCEAEAIIPHAMSEAEAAPLALARARRHVLSRYRTYWVPEERVERVALVYKRYWVFKRLAAGDAWVMDTFTGHLDYWPGSP